jgi:uncharacterized protein involved in outer membrane biogenesis
LTRDTSRRRWPTYLGWLAVILTMVLLIALLVLAFFPWGSAKGLVERELSSGIGRPVSIAAIERVGSVSLSLTVAIRGLSVPQAEWAGGGMLATVREAQVRFPVFSLLIGRFRPESVAISGMTLALVRDRDGRESWSREKKAPGGRGPHPVLRWLTIADSRLSYRDAKRNRSFSATMSADSRSGLVIKGTGLIHGAPVTLTAGGGAISGLEPGTRWPFKAVIEGKAVGLTLDGKMDGPLDIGHLSGKATGHADDLVLLDAIIEAGLPGTQPVRLTADVRRDRPDWTVTNLKGTIGRSDIAGHATIKKRDGRTRIDGAVSAGRFDFDDLSSNAGKREALAKRARFGKRVVPDTAIDLATVSKTDGRLDLNARKLLWPGSTPFRNLTGTLSLDHDRLVIDPLTLGLTRGRMVGRIEIVQHDIGPTLTVAMDVVRARLIDFFPDAQIDGSLRGRIRLTGPGRTIRLAIGRSTGAIALVAQDGVIPARTASLLGQDIGRGITTKEDEQAKLRCMVVRLDVREGIASANPVVIDTSRAQTRATGTINLSNETLALMLDGAPKKKSILRLVDTIPISGTIEAPDIRVPDQAKSAGGILKMLGRALSDKQGVEAQDADCPALMAQALR